MTRAPFLLAVFGAILIIPLLMTLRHQFIDGEMFRSTRYIPYIIAHISLVVAIYFRLRYLKMNGWLSLLGLISIINFLFSLYLFIIGPEREVVDKG